jgi:glycosyltransferase involved in cell wall biosynthesis
VETKAALLSYKNMNETVSDQVKGLKLILERRKDENESLIEAIRELSSQSEEQKRLGKLYHLVMLSRWSEAALSKKYESLLNENREMRKEFINTEQILQNKEVELHKAESQL